MCVRTHDNCFRACMGQRYVFQIETAFLVVMWILLSSASILVNKHIMYDRGFSYPVLLTTMHVICFALLVNLLAWCGAIRLSALHGRHDTVLLIACSFSVSVAFGNASYMYLPVPLIQIMKSASPLLSMCLGFALSIQKPTSLLVSCVVTITVGVSMVALSLPVTQWIGVALQTIAVLAEVTRLSLADKMLKENNGFSEWTLVHHCSRVHLVLCAVPCTVDVMTMFKDDVHAFENVGVPVFALSTACVMALSITSLRLIKRLSALTLHVSGIVKDVLLIAYFVVSNHVHVLPIQYLGYCVSAIGILVYSALDAPQCRKTNKHNKINEDDRDVVQSDALEVETTRSSEASSAWACRITWVCISQALVLLVAIHNKYGRQQGDTETNEVPTLPTLPTLQSSRLGCWDLSDWPFTSMTDMPDVYETQPPFTGTVDYLDFTSARSLWSVASPTHYVHHSFACQFEGSFVAPVSGHIYWKLYSDDGAVLYVNNQKTIDTSSVHRNGATSTEHRSQVLEGSRYDVRCAFFQLESGLMWRLFFRYADDPWQLFRSNVSAHESRYSCATSCKAHGLRKCQYTACRGCLECASTNSSTSTNRRVDVVVSAHNADVRFVVALLLRIPYSNLKLYCHGRHINDPRCEYLPNLSGEYAYIHHIVKFFDSLAEITLFVKGSIVIPEWYGSYWACENAFGIVRSLSDRQSQDVYPSLVFNRRVYQNYFVEDFGIKTGTQLQISSSGVTSRMVCHARVSPLGKFMHETFRLRADVPKKACWFIGSQFAVRRETIVKNDRRVYDRIKEEFEMCHEGEADEVAEFMERGWLALFYNEESTPVMQPSDICPQTITNVWS